MEGGSPTQSGTLNSSSSMAMQSPSLALLPSPANHDISNAYDPYWVATQIVTDPRRLGLPGPGLSNEQLADLCCILHPSGRPACLAAAYIHEERPEYTITNANNVHIREKVSAQDNYTFAEEFAAGGLVACDLALCLSAPLKDPVSGFQFGRNASRCDFVLGRNEESKRISNIHFRIYINEYGIMMLEDQSTNGTAVDGVLLRGKEKENGLQYRHTLSNGSVIKLTMTPPEQDYQFTVRLPQRDALSDREYEKNLTAFFLRNANLRAQYEARVVAGGIKRKLPDLFPRNSTTQSNPSSPIGSRKVNKEWQGGSKYNQIGILGKGAFAVVYKFTEKFSGMPYAAKELEKRRFMKNGILDEKVDNEMKIMRRIKHPHVVQYIEHVDWEDYLYIIMEFVPGGDLGTLIAKQGHLQELDVKTMAKQLLSALKYLHDGGITHRDVKPDNILISSRNPFHVKLTDFGLSKMIDSEETFLRTFCGTLLYCAPEVYSEYREYDETGQRHRRLDKRSLPPQKYGHAVDIWSLAGVLFYSLCGSPPYPVKSGTSYQELLNQIMTQALDIRPLQRANISEKGISFVRSMLRNRPENRATIEELERRSWFIGGDTFEVSMEEDEVDQIGGDGFLDPQLEEGASQLSINGVAPEIDDGAEMVDGDSSDVTEIRFRPHEIPSSLAISDNHCIPNAKKSCPPLHGNENPGNGRLFGEVNVSAIGSSGAIPADHFNLPLPAVERQSMLTDFSRESQYSQNYCENNDRSRVQSSPAVIMPPPPSPCNALATPRYPEIKDRAIQSSSLMGAESMVGHLNMDSPASAASAHAGSPALTTEDTRDATVSLRRLREEDYDENGAWRPADLPAKRRRSGREIDIRLPPSIFWDPKDKSTHHNNYPSMTTLEFKSYQEYAESKGEKFTHGEKTFDSTMQSFRSSRSSSLDPQRAYSEPPKVGARRLLMKRDDRLLAEEAEGEEKSELRNGQHGSNEQESTIPDTVRPSNAPTMAHSSPAPLTDHIQIGVGNKFQAPKRILAKAISTPDSVLPAISLNFTDSVTSWGRGFKTTNRYANGQETRIPKYAFKIMLFKPGFYTNKQALISSSHIWHEKDMNMSFYISTKATAGISVNGFRLQSHDRQYPSTKSRYWGELKCGDIITVWHNDCPEENTRLKFECYWGKSAELRKEPFHLLEEGDFLDELDEACVIQEQAIINEKCHREREDMMRSKQEKLARLNNKTFKSAPPCGGSLSAK
ncbi:unnamed protein product [Diplocarpon coronariae]|uniref:Autophagy-related protein 1 n=1 Tax=Diplocarpon coronariae TaxID=2795749 RepID=A0A218Z5Q0_9HELO|nr:hypothetical protein B2J93_3660 [Marssonina coronariae]